MDLAIIYTICGIISIIFSLIFSFTSSKRNYDHQIQEASKETGHISSDIGYIKSGVDDIKRRQEKQEEDFREVRERLTRVETMTEKNEHDIKEIRGDINK